MNTITRWNPFKEFDEMQEKLSSILGRSSLRGLGTGKEMLKVVEWTPLVDISEDDKEYLIKTELPEIQKEDVKVHVENGVLSIIGERKFEKEEKNKKYHRVERAYGNFVRSFSLPEDADPAKVNAEFKDGILKVHLIKGIQKKPKEIEVKIN